MADPRLTLMRGGVAAASLQGIVPAERYEPTTAWRCVVPVCGLHAGPDAASEQQDQLLFGEAFDVLAFDGDFAFGQARRDGYVGYVDRAALAPGAPEPTHWVRSLRTYAFSEPNIKSRILGLYSINCLVRVTATDGRFSKVEDAGWMTSAHLAPVGETAPDPAAVAEAFLSAPYQWGGRESAGSDCSGLAQQALYAAGRAAPRDTDLQAAGIGRPVEAADLDRGDLVFWKGHVGIMLDNTRLIHANAHHMMTAIEPLTQAVQRIGEPTAFRRP